MKQADKPRKDVVRNIKIESTVETTDLTTRGSRVVYEKNPFLGFTITANKRKQTVSAGTEIDTKTTEGEEVTTQTTIAQIQLVDDEQYIKFFTSNVAQIYNLTTQGLKLFTLLLVEVQASIGGDEVFLTPAIISKIASKQALTMSKSTYHRGINDLIEAKIIAPSSQGVGWYFINPTVLFNGDRVRFVKEYRKDSTTKKINRSQTTLKFEESSNSDDF